MFADPLAELREQDALAVGALRLQSSHLAGARFQFVGDVPPRALERLYLAVVLGHPVGLGLPDLDVVPVGRVPVDLEVGDPGARFLARRQPVEPVDDRLVVVDQVVERVVVPPAKEPALRRRLGRVVDERRVDAVPEVGGGRAVRAVEQGRNRRRVERSAGDRLAQVGEERERLPDAHEVRRVGAPAGDSRREAFEVRGLGEKLCQPVARERRRRERPDGVVSSLDLRYRPAGADEPLAQEPSARRRLGVVEGLEQRRPVAGHRRDEFEVPPRRRVEAEVVAPVVRPDARHRGRHGLVRRRDVREGGARGGDCRARQSDPLDGARTELLGERPLRPTRAERPRLVERQRRVGGLAEAREDRVVVAQVRARQHLRRVEPREFGGRPVGVVDGRREELARRHVRERESVPAVDADQRREVARRGVAGVEERPRGHDAGHLALVAPVGQRLVALVRDGDAVAPLDQRTEVRRELRARHARHRVRGPARGFL